MTEYIERAKAEKAFQDGCHDVFECGDGYFEAEQGFSDNAVREILKGIPSVDVAKVRHGRWIRYPDCGVTKYTACKWSIEEAWHSNYCPNCGAKMDLEVEDG